MSVHIYNNAEGTNFVSNLALIRKGWISTSANCKNNIITKQEQIK